MGAMSGLSNLPLIGSLFPNQDEQESNRRQLEASAAYSAYRPAAVKARTQALQNQLGAFQGVNGMLQQKYGAGPNMASLMKDPTAETGVGSIGGTSYDTSGPDAGDVLGGAGKGALLGATVGSVVPGIGTAIGGVGGGILGALGSMGTQHNTVGFRRA